MSDRKDYLVTVSIRNAPMKRAMTAAGFETAAELSRATGVNQAEIGQYFGLKRTPYKKTGDFGLRESAIKIAEALNVLPEDLFPPQHLNDPLEKNSSTAEMGVDEITKLSRGDVSMELLTDQKNILEKLSSELTERQKFAIEFYSKEDETTLDELGEILEVSRERARQIYTIALRKMKNKADLLGIKRSSVFGRN